MLEKVETNREHAERVIRERNAAFDLVGSIIAWESGEMSAEEEIDFVQHLWRTGDWKHLQGCYHRLIRDHLRLGNIA